MGKICRNKHSFKKSTSFYQHICQKASKLLDLSFFFAFAPSLRLSLLMSASTRWCCLHHRRRWWRRARASPCSSSTRWGRPGRPRPGLPRWSSRGGCFQKDRPLAHCCGIFFLTENLSLGGNYRLAPIQDQLIKKMAMEQKMRREAMALEQRRVRAGQQNHVYNAHILWHTLLFLTHDKYKTFMDWYLL